MVFVGRALKAIAERVRVWKGRRCWIVAFSELRKESGPNAIHFSWDAFNTNTTENREHERAARSDRWKNPI